MERQLFLNFLNISLFHVTEIADLSEVIMKQDSLLTIKTKKDWMPRIMSCGTNVYHLLGVSLSFAALAVSLVKSSFRKVSPALILHCLHSLGRPSCILPEKKSLAPSLGSAKASTQETEGCQVQRVSL